MNLYKSPSLEREFAQRIMGDWSPYQSAIKDYLSNSEYEETNFREFLQDLIESGEERASKNWITSFVLEIGFYQLNFELVAMYVHILHEKGITRFAKLYRP